MWYKNMLKKLQDKNPNLTIKSIHDSSFSRYGKILNPKDYFDIINYLNQETIIPETGNKYVAHDPNLEARIKNKQGINHVFGYMPVEYGYVNGKNSKLNALEYHKSSEINIALTPLIVMLGRVEDIVSNQYTTQLIDVFFVPEGTVIELFPQTLHFSPCKVLDQGFKCGVILPFGTNMEFIRDKKITHEEDHLLFKTNKWILVHQDHQTFIDLGAHLGLIGQNIEIKY